MTRSWDEGDRKLSGPDWGSAAILGLVIVGCLIILAVNR